MGCYTPALLARTVLDRLNAVLDPEDRVNGAVDLTGKMPIRSSGSELGDNTRRVPAAHNSAGVTHPVTDADGAYMWGEGEIPSWPAAGIWAELKTGAITLQDFYQAEKMDELTRDMRQMVDMYPEYGEELAIRFAAGLNVDVGAQAFVLYEKSNIFGRNMRSGMDGPSLDVMQTDMVTQHQFTVPVPSTEFGGVVITFASVRPDESLASQPHPIASDTWSSRNYLADEMAIDPVPVTVRELYSDCDQVDENTITCYIGNNHLQKNYVHYGFIRQLDPTDVENKLAIWQLQVPMSVTPDSVIYPETLSHYPFNDQNAEVCTYTSQTTVTVRTPTIFGPSPVVELAIIETADVFGEDDQISLSTQKSKENFNMQPKYLKTLISSSVLKVLILSASHRTVICNGLLVFCRASILFKKWRRLPNIPIPLVLLGSYT